MTPRGRVAAGLLQFPAKEVSSSKDLDKRLGAAQPPREPERGEALLLYLGLLRPFLCWMGRGAQRRRLWPGGQAHIVPSSPVSLPQTGALQPLAGNAGAAAFLGVLLKGGRR